MIGKNNPFNIRYSPLNKWLGLTGQTKGFCDFQSLDYCVRAVAILVLRSYRKKDILTISEIINRYAPKSENNTDNYVSFVCARLGCFPFDIPDSIGSYARLLESMSIFEGNRVNMKFILDVINAFNIKPYGRKISSKHSK